MKRILNLGGKWWSIVCFQNIYESVGKRIARFHHFFASVEGIIGSII
ncbi:hypothetical protein M3689_05290 [Alkalihalophilus marmarensis]|nr:hypothetical protein [Alkalihalophilus marmarensis]MCM3488719.1 hypothetical protein [Alkalihalophilus marmarensis]